MTGCNLRLRNFNFFICFIKVMMIMQVYDFPFVTFGIVVERTVTRLTLGERRRTYENKVTHELSLESSALEL